MASGVKYDMFIVYKTLSALRDSETKSLNIVELAESAKVSPTTLEKYIEVLKSRGFVIEKTQ